MTLILYAHQTINCDCFLRFNICKINPVKNQSSLFDQWKLSCDNRRQSVEFHQRCTINTKAWGGLNIILLWRAYSGWLHVITWLMLTEGANKGVVVRGGIEASPLFVGICVDMSVCEYTHVRVCRCACARVCMCMIFFIRVKDFKALQLRTENKKNSLYEQLQLSSEGITLFLGNRSWKIFCALFRQPSVRGWGTHKLSLRGTPCAGVRDCVCVCL